MITTEDTFVAQSVSKAIVDMKTLNLFGKDVGVTDKQVGDMIGKTVITCHRKRYSKDCNRN